MEADTARTDDGQSPGIVDTREALANCTTTAAIIDGNNVNLPEDNSGLTSVNYKQNSQEIIKQDEEHCNDDIKDKAHNGSLVIPSGEETQITNGLLTNIKTVDDELTNDSPRDEKLQGTSVHENEALPVSSSTQLPVSLVHNGITDNQNQTNKTSSETVDEENVNVEGKELNHQENAVSVEVADIIETKPAVDTEESSADSPVDLADNEQENEKDNVEEESHDDEPLDSTASRSVWYNKETKDPPPAQTPEAESYSTTVVGGVVVRTPLASIDSNKTSPRHSTGSKFKTAWGSLFGKKRSSKDKPDGGAQNAVHDGKDEGESIHREQRELIQDENRNSEDEIVNQKALLPEHSEQPEQQKQPEHSEQPEQQQQPEQQKQLEHFEQPEHQEHLEQPKRLKNQDQPEQQQQPEQQEHLEHQEQPEQQQHLEHSEQPKQLENQEHFEQTKQLDYQEQLKQKDSSNQHTPLEQEKSEMDGQIEQNEQPEQHKQLEPGEQLSQPGEDASPTDEDVVLPTHIAKRESSSSSHKSPTQMQMRLTYAEGAKDGSKVVEVIGTREVIMRPDQDKPKSPDDCRLSCRDLGDVDHEGWLTKRGGGAIFTTWKRKWVVLKEGQLYYYKTSFDAEPGGVLTLQNCTIVAAPAIKKKFCFTIEKQDVKASKMFLAADSHEEMDKWMFVLCAASRGEVIMRTTHNQSTIDDGKMRRKANSISRRAGSILGRGGSNDKAEHIPRRTSSGSSPEDIHNLLVSPSTAADTEQQDEPTKRVELDPDYEVAENSPCEIEATDGRNMSAVVEMVTSEQDASLSQGTEKMKTVPIGDEATPIPNEMSTSNSESPTDSPQIVPLMVMTTETSRGDDITETIATHDVNQSDAEHAQPRVDPPTSPVMASTTWYMVLDAASDAWVPRDDDELLSMIRNIKDARVSIIGTPLPGNQDRARALTHVSQHNAEVLRLRALKRSLKDKQRDLIAMEELLDDKEVNRQSIHEWSTRYSYLTEDTIDEHNEPTDTCTHTKQDVGNTGDSMALHEHNDTINEQNDNQDEPTDTCTHTKRDVVDAVDSMTLHEHNDTINEQNDNQDEPTDTCTHTKRDTGDEMAIHTHETSRVETESSQQHSVATSTQQQDTEEQDTPCDQPRETRILTHDNNNTQGVSCTPRDHHDDQSLNTKF